MTVCQWSSCQPPWRSARPPRPALTNPRAVHPLKASGTPTPDLAPWRHPALRTDPDDCFGSRQVFPRALSQPQGGKSGCSAMHYRLSLARRECAGPLHHPRATCRRERTQPNQRARLQLPARRGGAQGLCEAHHRCVSQLHPLLMGTNNSPGCVQGEDAQVLVAKQVYCPRQNSNSRV